MRVSVVIPMLDEAKHIATCLAALDAQTVPPDEVVIVDNGSRDGSAEVVNSLSGRLRAITPRLVVEGRRGPAAARNRGLRLATGDVIAFTDADCIPAPTWTEGIHRAFRADPDLDGVGGMDAGIRTGASTIEKMLAATWLAPERLRRDVVLADKTEWLSFGFVSTFNCAFTADLLRALGGFDETFVPAGEDVDLCLRAIEVGARIKPWNRSIAVYHNQDCSLSQLVRRMFFYGEAVAHLARRHFGDKIVVQMPGPKGGVTIRPARAAPVLLFAGTVKLLAAVTAFAMVAAVSRTLAVYVSMAALVYGTTRIALGITRRGYPLSPVECVQLPWLWAVRKGAEQAGRLYGSVRYRVCCA